MRTTITILGTVAAMALAPIAIAQARHGQDDDNAARIELQGTSAKPITISSYSAGVLTLTQGGRTTAGTVTAATEIHCAASARPARHGADDGRGHDKGDDRGHARSHDDSRDCDAGNLKAGAKVREASLVQAAGGLRFREIELAGAARR